MAVQKRVSFVISAEQSMLLQNSVNKKGSSKVATTPIGYVSAGQSASGFAEVYRDLQRYPFEWPADMHQVIDAWVTLYGATPYALGASPKVKIGRLATDFVEEGGTSSSWTDNTSDDDNWQDSEFPIGAEVTSAAGLSTGANIIKVPGLIEAIAPTSVLKRAGTHCDGTPDHGWVIYSADDSTTTDRWGFRTKNWSDPNFRPTVTIVYDASIPPPAPVPVLLNGLPADTGATTTIDSADAKRLTVEFISSPAAGFTTDRVELTVYAAGATVDEAVPAQPVTGTVIATTGAVVPTSTGQLNHYTVSLTGLRPRETQLYRLRVRNQDGVWGPWSPLVQGSIFSAYTPSVPLDPRMTSDPTGPVVSATLNTMDPLDGVTGLRGTFVRHNLDGSTTNLWPDVDTTGIGIAYVAGAKRAVVPWKGISLNDGDAVSWRVSLRSRDLVWSPLTAERTTTMRTVVGPTITPSDSTTKLTSRTTGVSIDDPTEFDGYRYRLYRNDVLFYTSPVIGITPDTTADITFPAGRLNWGDTFGIEAETRPTDTTVFGPTSTRAVLYIDTLPRTSLTPMTEDGIAGDILPTEDIIWLAPYSDPDAARYGERPVARLLEIRHAATPQGSGDLVEQRLGIHALKPLTDDEESGFAILPLTSASGWVADANVSLGTANLQPTDYVGNSLALTFASSSTDRGARYTFPEPLDLSRFSSHARFLIWSRLTSETNLSFFNMRVESSLTDFVEWHLYDPADNAPNAWDDDYPTLGFPDHSVGAIDWSAVTSVLFWADCSGSFAGTAYLRDLSIGAVPYQTTPPDDTSAIAFEHSYDARVRYRDDADTLVTTTLATASAGGDDNIKVASVVGLVVGQDITIGSDADRLQETATIASVGTAGSGGTGVGLTTSLFLAHPGTPTVRVLPWGLWTAWRTVRSSAPPVAVAVSPAPDAIVTDPTTDFVHSYSSPGGKLQAYRTLRIYRRTNSVDRLLYERDVDGTGTTTTGPVLLLEDGLEYVWEVTVYDTDGLSGTTERSLFTTDFTVPDPVSTLTATADPATSTVTLAWNETDADWGDADAEWGDGDAEWAALSAGVAFYIIRWRDADGQEQRVDLGPRTLDDERTPLSVARFVHRGARLGVNVYRVSAHNGAQESDPVEAEVTLQPARGGAWMLAVDDERGLAWPVDAQSAPRKPTSTVETFRPPGRPDPVHLHWGLSGRHTSLKVRYLPSDAALARAISALLHTGAPVWLKSPSAYDYDVMRARVVDAGPEDPQQYGFVDLSIELDEIAPEVPG